MHRCLDIPEILQHIFQDVDTDDGLRRDLPSLAALARTCRSFSPVALDNLWGVLVGLDPILRCMPSDLYSSDEKKLLRAMKVSDWERPLVYMNRIKELSVNPRRADADLFTSLNASVPAEAEQCFPRLTCLRWRTSVEDDLPSIRFLLSPRLTTLVISFPSGRTSISFISSIPRLCPGLKELQFGYWNNSISDKLAVSDFLCRLHSLQQVRIDIPDLPTLIHLCRLPNLTSFHGSLPEPFPTQATSSTLSLSVLKKLSIQNSTIEAAIGFFSLCTTPAVQSLEIDIEPSPRVVDIDRLHTALKQSCSHTSLSNFVADYSEQNPPEMPADAYMIPIHTFQLLFCFGNLRSISIVSHLGFNLNDEELKAIALAWPRLQSLWLAIGEYAPYQAPGLSLRSLSILAQYCVSLNYLKLSFDATSVPEIDSAFNGTHPIPQLALRKLDVDRSLISAPSIYVARFLSSLFPNLVAIFTARTFMDNDDPNEPEETMQAIQYHRLWMEVGVQLPVLNAVRKEERSRVQGVMDTDS
ncbi:hypothetical protein R3P38DRAFT_1204381 [Favolaschia claudopus]|uniref:F-box domain-containing protein n=1 Tax=Favolaschia claudopus TaxID=2862362 RepID=A0AAW0B4N0_9AGAR